MGSSGCFQWHLSAPLPLSLPLCEMGAMLVLCGCFALQIQNSPADAYQYVRLLGLALHHVMRVAFVHYRRCTKLNHRLHCRKAILGAVHAHLRPGQGTSGAQRGCTAGSAPAKEAKWPGFFAHAQNSIKTYGEGQRARDCRTAVGTHAQCRGGRERHACGGWHARAVPGRARAVQTRAAVEAHAPCREHQGAGAALLLSLPLSALVSRSAAAAILCVPFGRCAGKGEPLLPPPAPAPARPPMGVKLFVGNVPEETSQVELRELFEAAAAEPGEVLSVALMKQFAFVHMRDDEAAERAILKLNGHPLHGRRVVVEPSRPRPTHTVKIFVGNVSAACTSGELRVLFQQYGPVVECDVVKGTPPRPAPPAPAGGQGWLQRAGSLEHVQSARAPLTPPAPSPVRRHAYDELAGGRAGGRLLLVSFEGRVPRLSRARGGFRGQTPPSLSPPPKKNLTVVEAPFVLSAPNRPSFLHRFVHLGCWKAVCQLRRSYWLEQSQDTQFVPSGVALDVGGSPLDLSLCTVERPKRDTQPPPWGEAATLPPPAAHPLVLQCRLLACLEGSASRRYPLSNLCSVERSSS